MIENLTIEQKNGEKKETYIKGLTDKQNINDCVEKKEISLRRISDKLDFANVNTYLFLQAFDESVGEIIKSV